VLRKLRGTDNIRVEYEDILLVRPHARRRSCDGLLVAFVDSRSVVALGRAVMAPAACSAAALLARQHRAPPRNAHARLASA
jgi:hypothetical protein